jgi:hypothetical protein
MYDCENHSSEVSSVGVYLRPSGKKAEAGGKMKTWKFFFACVCLVAFTQVVWSQGVIGSSSEHGIPGFLNPKTGTFTTRAQAQQPRATQATITGNYYFGKVVVTLTVFIGSAFPSGTQYSCHADANTFDGGSTGNENSFDESVSALAGPVTSGGYTSCTLTMPYLWQLASPSTDQICVDFEVDALNTASVSGLTEIVSFRSASRGISECVTGVPTGSDTTTSFAFSTRL